MMTHTAGSASPCTLALMRRPAGVTSMRNCQPLQLAGDEPAAGHRLPAPAGDPGLEAAEPAALAPQQARFNLGRPESAC
jgi:hypothetical protein